MIYIIQLPEDSRAIPLLEQLRGRPVRIMNAIDTRTDAKADVYRSKVETIAWKGLLEARKSGRRTAHESITNGALGCYLSHCHVWRDVLRSNDNVAVVFEEDARITGITAFTSLLLPPTDSWDIILFGYIDLDQGSGGTQGCWKRVTRFLETHAYAIHKRAISKVWGMMLPIQRQLDWHLSHLASTGQITILGHTPALVTQDRTLGTTIQDLMVK